MVLYTGRAISAGHIAGAWRCRVTGGGETLFIADSDEAGRRPAGGTVVSVINATPLSSYVNRISLSVGDLQGAA